MGVKDLERPIHSLRSSLTHSATLAVTQLAALLLLCSTAGKSAPQVCTATHYNHPALLQLLCAAELAIEVWGGSLWLDQKVPFKQKDEEKRTGARAINL